MGGGGGGIMDGAGAGGGGAGAGGLAWRMRNASVNFAQREQTGAFRGRVERLLAPPGVGGGGLGGWGASEEPHLLPGREFFSFWEELGISIEASTVFAESVLRKLLEMGYDRAAPDTPLLQRPSPRGGLAAMAAPTKKWKRNPVAELQNSPTLTSSPTSRGRHGLSLSSPHAPRGALEDTPMWKTLTHPPGGQLRTLATVVFGPGGTSTPGALQRALLNTLLTMSLQSSVNPLTRPIDLYDSGVKSALAAYMARSNRRGAVGGPLDQTWEDYVVSLLLEKEAEVVESMMENAGLKESGIKFMGAITQCLKNLPKQISDAASEEDIGCGELGSISIYHWLLEETHGACPLRVLTACVRHLKHLASEGGSSSSKTTRVSALIYMMDQFLCIATCPVEILEEAQEALRPFKLEPEPLGGAAARLASTIRKEMSAPGAASRGRLLDVAPALRPVIPSEHGREISVRCRSRSFVRAPARMSIIGMIASTLEGEQEAAMKPARRGQCVHVFFNPHSAHSNNLMSIVNWNTSATKNRLTIAEEDLCIKLHLMKSMLASSGSGSAANLLDKAPQVVSLENFNGYYREALSAFLKAESLPPGEAKTFREARLDSIGQSILEEAQGAGAGATAESKDKWGRVRNLVREGAFHLTMPRPPPVVYDLINTDTLYEAGGSEVLEGSLGGMGEREYEVPLTSCGKELMQVLQKYHPAMQHHYAYNSKNEHVRVAIVGGDATVHNTVMGYVYVLKHHPELLENIDLQFYLLPTGSRNQLASFIAQHDSWYQASAFSAAMNQLPVVPQLRPSESHEIASWQAAETVPAPAEAASSSRKSIFHSALGDATRRLSKSAIASSKVKTAEEESFSKRVAPCENLSRVLSGYLREAKEKLKVSIFICEAWAAVGRKTYHYNIPFCCRVEMGLPAHIVSQGAIKTTSSISHKSQSGSAGLPRAACLKEDDFETLANRFALKATLTLNRRCLGESESTSSTVMAPSQGFSSITVNNIPRIGDSARIVHPSSDALDVNIVEADWASRMRRRVHCMDDFHDSQTALCGQVQVETVRKKPFDITIDGQVYGPFFRIKISSCQTGHRSEGAIAKFPVMHNLPLQT